MAAAFRALFHYEWIPSTVAFLFFNLFGQLCYYQGTTLVVVPPKLVLSLLALIKWFSLDMYDGLGKYCSDSNYMFDAPNLQRSGSIIARPVPNCTDSIVVLGPDVQDADDAVVQIGLIQNTTVANNDLNCGGAVALHATFITCCIILCAITFGVMIILLLADYNIRRRRPERHFFLEKHERLKGASVCIVLVVIAATG